MNSKTPFWLLLPGGVFLLVDRFFKWQALHAWSNPNLLSDNFGWEPFLNKGIAFGVIIPVPIIVLLTLFIIGSVLYFFYIHLKYSPEHGKTSAGIGLALILTGAVSNLADRVIYGETVDYFRIFTSMVNIADCLIIAGFVLYFASLKHLK